MIRLSRIHLPCFVSLLQMNKSPIGFSCLSSLLRSLRSILTSSRSPPKRSAVLKPRNSLLLLGASELWIGQIPHLPSLSSPGPTASRTTPPNIQWLRLDVLLGLEIDATSQFIVLQDLPMDSSVSFLVASSSLLSFVECELTTSCRAVFHHEVSSPLGSVHVISPVCSHTADSVSFLLGTSHGLFWVDLFPSTRKLSIEPLQTQGGVESLDITTVSETSASCTVAFGSSSLHRLFLFESSERHDFSKWRFFWGQNSIEDNVTTLSFDVEDGSLWVGSQIALNWIDEELEATYRIGGVEGLPFAQFLCSVATERRVFFGTTQGIVVWDKVNSKWEYFNGDRFIHGSSILSLSLLDPSSKDGTGGLLVLSDQGGSIIDWKVWTLEQKAAFYEEMVVPRHDRDGLVSDVGLRKYGDLTTYYKRSSDNDGSWSGIYLDAEILRYAVTKAPEAKQRIDLAFSGMELLMTVSGEKGFPARSVLPVGAPLPGGEWFNSTVMPELQFKADTSSDEVDNHVFSYALAYDLLDDFPSLQNKALEFLDDLVSNIISHDFYLLDFNSTKPTTWGKWNPLWLNDGGDDFDTWANNRGLNSLEILSFVLAAYRLTGKEIYLTAFDKLNSYGYVENIINTKIMATVNMNHFDDDLEALSALSLYRSLESLHDPRFDRLRVTLKKCSVRLYNFIKKERSSEFAAIYAIISDDSTFDVAESIARTLREWPQEMIDWPVENSNRMDVRLNPERMVREVISPNERMKVLSYRELSMYRWDRSPYNLDTGSGYTEYDPGAFLFPYWLCRYYSLITSSSD